MKRYFKKLYGAFCVCSFLYPLTALCGFYLNAENPYLWFVSALCCALLGSLTSLLPGKLRLGWFALCSVLLGFIFPLGLLPVIVFTLFLLLVSAPAAPGTEWSAGVWIGALLFSMLGPVIGFFLEKSQTPGAEFLIASLRFNLFVFVGLFILHKNRAGVEEGIGAGQESAAPRHIRRRNTAMALASLAVLYLCACWGWLSERFSRLLSLIGSAVSVFIEWLKNLLITREPLSGQEEGFASGSDFGLPGGEPAPFWLFLEKVARIALYFALAAITVWLLIRLFKLSKKFIRWLRLRLQEANRALNETYSDKVESILDIDELRRTVSERLHLTHRPKTEKIDWKALDSRGKIRYAYTLLVRGKEISPASTARNVLTRELSSGLAAQDPSRLADIYDAARYSSTLPDKTAADAMCKAAKLGG